MNKTRNIFGCTRCSKKIKTPPIEWGVGLIVTRDNWTRIMDKMVTLYYRDLNEEENRTMKKYINHLQVFLTLLR